MFHSLFHAALILLILSAGALHAGEQNLADLTEAVGVVSPELGEKVEFSSIGGRNIRMVRWDSARKRYCEITLPASAVFSVPCRAEVAAKFYFPQKNTIHGITLRIRDTHGEIFQIRKKISKNLVGWHELIWAIDSDCPPKESWGKQKNGRMDLPLRLSGFSIEYTAASSESYLGLERLRWEISPKQIQSFLQTGSSVNVVLQGQESKLAIVVKGGGRDEKVCFNSKVMDGNGYLIGRVAKELEIKKGEESVIPLPTLKQYGPYVVEWNVNGKSFRQRFAYVPGHGINRNWKKDDFVFGVCSHPERHSWMDQAKEAEAAELAGANVLRMDYIWGHFNPSMGKWTFDAGDRRCDLFAAHGVRIAPILGTYAFWARDRQWIPVNPAYKAVYRGRPDFTHYRNFLRGLLTHYKGKMDFVELCNEPDLAGALNISSDDYAAMARILYEEARTIDPAYRILSGGFATYEVDSAKSAEPKMLQNCVQKTIDYYDHFAFHGHGAFENFQSVVEKHIRFRRSVGDTRPWYANETAISATGNSEKIQSETLFKKLLFSWANGAMGYNWYDLRNDGTDPRNSEHNFGLFTYDFEPKEPFSTFHMLAWKFGGAKYKKAMASNDKYNLWLFEAVNGNWLLPGWNRTDSYQIYFIQNISSEAAQVDLWGNSQKIRVRNGVAALVLNGESPGLWEFGKKKQAPNMFPHAFLDIPKKIPREPGASRKITIPLQNPFDQEFRVAWRVSAQGENIASGISIIPPKGNGMIDFVAGEADMLNLILENDLWGTLSLPICITEPLMIPLEYRKNADFRLYNSAQVVSLMIPAPENGHLFWSGPDDLSVFLWGAAQKGELCFRIRVKDDKHCPYDDPKMMWKGDSVQLALKFLDGRGMWNIGFARNSLGLPNVWVWQAPKNYHTGKNAAFQLHVSRKENLHETYYEIRLPYHALGIKSHDVLLFNFLTNDNDHGVRDSYMELTRGLGEQQEPQAETATLLQIP